MEDFGTCIAPGVPRTAPRRPQGTYGLVTIDLDRPNRAWQLPGPKTSRGSTKIHSNPGFSLCHPIREILKDFLKIPICGPHVFLSNHIQPPCACDPTCGITSYYTYKKLLSFTFLNFFFIFAILFSKILKISKNHDFR